MAEAPAPAPPEVQIDIAAQQHDPNLDFVEAPAPAPPEVQIVVEAPAPYPPEVQIAIAAQQHDPRQIAIEAQYEAGPLRVVDDLLLSRALVPELEALWQVLLVRYAATQPLPDDDDDAFE